MAEDSWPMSDANNQHFRVKVEQKWGPFSWRVEGELGGPRLQGSSRLLGGPSRSLPRGSQASKRGVFGGFLPPRVDLEGWLWGRDEARPIMVYWRRDKGWREAQCGVVVKYNWHGRRHTTPCHPCLLSLSSLTVSHLSPSFSSSSSCSFCSSSSTSPSSSLLLLLLFFLLPFPPLKISSKWNYIWRCSIWCTTGTVLASLLFIIMISDIDSEVKESIVTYFAEQHQIQ